MAMRDFLFKKCTKCFFRCTHYHVFKRTLFHPDVLGITNYLRKRRVLNQILGDQKEKFISRIESTTSDELHVFKDDVKTFIYVADSKRLQTLCIKLFHLYQKQLSDSGELRDINDNELLLKMLYSSKEVYLALQVFYKKKPESVRYGFASQFCFILVMDMLYKAKRHEGVTWLYTKSKEHHTTMNWKLACLYFGSQYQLGTRKAFDQVQAELNDLSSKNVILPTRCLFFVSMLAFKQEEYAAMLEMYELPVCFSDKSTWGKENNLKLLAYVHLEREEEAVSLLQSLFLSTRNFFPIVFRDVLDAVREKVLRTDNIELKESLHEIEQVLETESLIRNQTLVSFCESPVGWREITKKKLFD